MLKFKSKREAEKEYKLELPEDPQELIENINELAMLLNEEQSPATADKVEVTVVYTEAEQKKTYRERKDNFKANCEAAGITKKMFSTVNQLDNGKMPDEIAALYKCDRSTINTYIYRAKTQVLKLYPDAYLPLYDELIEFLNRRWD